MATERATARPVAATNADSAFSCAFGWLKRIEHVEHTVAGEKPIEKGFEGIFSNVSRTYLTFLPLLFHRLFRLPKQRQCLYGGLRIHHSIACPIPFAQNIFDASKIKNRSQGATGDDSRSR